MATTIVPNTLKVTITEEIVVDGVDRGSKHVQIVPSVTELARRTIEVPTSEIEILAFAADNPAAGSFDEADVRYIRITNKDDVNFATLIFKNESNDEFAFKLDFGCTFIYSCDQAAGVVNTFDAEAGAISTITLADLVNISALSNSGACDLELVVAGV
jgi:hypothetical protein